MYAPRRHREVIARIYERLGVTVEFAALSRAAHRGEPRLYVSVNPKRAVATVRIPTYGRDLPQHIRSEVLRQLRDNVVVVNVYLDLSTPRHRARGRRPRGRRVPVHRHPARRPLGDWSTPILGMTSAWEAVRDLRDSGRVAGVSAGSVISAARVAGLSGALSGATIR